MERLYGAKARTTESDNTYNCHGYAWIGVNWDMDMGNVNNFWHPTTGGYVETNDLRLLPPFLLRIIEVQ